ncbi:MAG TPA: TIR domain-containing protein [Candidatus Binatia bacterium]|nr:TIR domain-containing protein [Candidatus Binatia bacterium]
MNYKAFMSYSHAADSKVAPSLQSALQAFAKPWYKLRAIRIFRDKTTLAMTPGLWPSIQAALDQSEYFLLLASVESAQSLWVEREVEYWLEHRGLDKLLIIVTGSSPFSAEDALLDFNWIRANLLPSVLRNRTTKRRDYTKQVLRAGLGEMSTNMYIDKADYFVRWLKRDFEPGSRGNSQRKGRRTKGKSLKAFEKIIPCRGFLANGFGVSVSSKP